MNRHQPRILVREPPKHLRDMRFEVTGSTRLVPDNNVMARDAVAGVGIALLPRGQAAPFVVRGSLPRVVILCRRSVPFSNLALANMSNT
jgi:DNA-binding transcriptional LysR family regulator